MKKVFTISLIFQFIYAFSTFSQGCSDAGFCTMGAMKPDQEFNKNSPVQLRSISLNLYEGQANTSPSIKAAILDMSFRILDKVELQFKVPYMTVQGNFGNTQGLGDLSLAATAPIKRQANYDILATVGLKIPTNTADKKVEGKNIDLPMYYQTSLGTFDLVLGGSIISRDWLLSVGYQQPLIHINENTFTADSINWSWYEGGMGYVRGHDDAKGLRRGADIMFRVERNFRMSRFNFNLGLLPIYRITKDQGKDALGNYQKIPGTTGLALSGLVGCGYNFNIYSNISLIVGYKITQRDYNPDGLTRKHVINFAYTYNF